jgi:hypothetical protein
MARHDDQPQVRVIPVQGTKRLQGELLLRGLRAPRQKDRVNLGKARQPAQARHLWCSPVSLHAVKLHRSPNPHVPCAEVREAVAILL